MRYVLAVVFLCSSLACAIEPLTSISFSGGVDYSRICSEIDQQRACDSSNMYGDRVGSADTRNGSHRLNETAVSTNPFSALFSATISSAGRQLDLKIGISGDTIYYSTDSPFQRWAILYRGLLTSNQRFTFASAQGSVYMTGDALSDPIFKFDVVNSSFGLSLLNASTWSAVIHAKYLLWENGYMLAGNVREVRNGLASPTTYYDDRVYYSYVLQPSSFSVDRFLNVNPGDNDFITGLTSKRTSSIGSSLVNVYKTGAVYGAVWTLLNPLGEGGDQKIVKLADGFGHVAESPPENIGSFDVVLSRDGILQWDGGMLSRERIEAERILISGQIRPLINKLVRRNTYKKSIIRHYPKSNYLVFAYEDPDLFPHGRLNSSMFYDLLTGEWWPMKNWIIGSIETDKGPGGTGSLMYGDGMDGYVHAADDPVDSDDSRKEISIDDMEKTDGWANAAISRNISTGTVAVGTASLVLQLNNNTSSITKVFIMPLGEWYDKSKSTGTDKLSFKVAASSRGFLTRLRVDLHVEDVQNQFNLNFSSVVISSAALASGSSVFTTIEIALSSFSLLDHWVSIDSETIPFARNFTRFGLRFVATATAELNLFFDDVRLVQGTKNPIDPLRITKRDSFGVLSNKNFMQIMLAREKQRDSSISVDVFTGQGNLKNTVTIPPEVSKEIFVLGFSSIPGITGLSSVDFERTRSTTSASADVFDFVSGNANSDFIFAFDSQSNRIAKVDLSSISVFVSSYGALGPGTTNFDYVQDIAVETNENGNILVTDHMNHRLKEHRQSDLSFVREYGQLGTGTTSLYNPTSADWDSGFIWVFDDGNQRIARFGRDYSFRTEVKLDINTIGDGIVRAGPDFLFDAYNRGSDDAVYFVDVFLEKRTKSDMGLLNRVVLRPEGIVASSSYSLKGLAMHSKFVYVSFNDTALDEGTYYIQKRLQEDLSLVSELRLTAKNSGLIGDGLARETARDVKAVNLGLTLPDPYIQLKFYSKGELENQFKLSAMSQVLELQPYIP